MKQKIMAIIGTLILPGILLSLLSQINLVTATPINEILVCPPEDGCDYSTINAALLDAADGDTINIQSGTYTETLVVTRSVTFHGDHPDLTIVDGNRLGTVFAIDPGVTVTIENLTIQNGFGEDGGGIYNDGVMTVTNSILKNNESNGDGGGGIVNFSGAIMNLLTVTITSNQAVFGAGIYNDGLLTIENSAVTQNTTIGLSPLTGGGIENDGTVILVNSEISGNTAVDNGAGIENAGILIAKNSQISGNMALEGTGGGINNISTGNATIISSTIHTNSGGAGGGFNNEGAAWLTNSLLHTNVATNTNAALPRGGGGIRNDNGGIITVTNSTVSGNNALELGGGGLLNTTISSTVLLRSSTFYQNIGTSLYNLTGTITLSNTIIGANLAGGFECVGVGIVSDGSNLDSGNSCGLGVGELSNTDPQLGPLQDNGGPTLTHATEITSPAVDATDVCEETDQRGVSRPVGLACDIGAFETGAYTVFLPITIK